MATVRAALHALVLEHTDPEVLLNLLGRALGPDLKDGRFITMFLGVLDPADHSVQYANAGHAPTLRYHAATGEFFPLESTGMPLGIADSPAYHQGWPFTFEVGDMLVLATDGIVETLNRADQRFGIQGLESMVRRSASHSVNEIVRRLGDAVMSHCDRLSPPDDLTVLVVRRNR
jgi:serine phosphatase RsbU (regulator of sigma subunit)